MRSSEKSLKVTSLGLRSQLSQARLLFQGLTTHAKNSKQELTPIKQILLKHLRPFLDNQQMIPGLTTGLSTVLSKVSDDDVLKFCTELEKMLGDILDEMNDQNTSTADLDMRDHNASTT